MPPGFVVKNGSNIRSRSLTGIPGPESSTDTNTVDPTVETRCDPQTSRFRGHGDHGVDSISDEVQENLLELRDFQMHLGKVVLKLRSDGHFVDLKIVLQQSQC